jgi:hypothetical protein
MRIAEPLVRSGLFWRPGKEDYKAPGTLTIDAAGKVRLEVLGSFSGPTGSFEEIQDDTMTIGRVVGQIEKEGLLTLEHCFYRKRPYGFGSVVKSEIEASWAILGVAFDPDEEIRFDEQCVSIEGFEEWLRVSGLSLSIFDHLHFYSIEYRRPDAITLYDGVEFTLSVGFGHTMPSMTDVKHAEINSSAYLKISAREAQKPSFFFSIITRLREFTSFAIDDTVSISKVWAANNAITVPIGEDETKPAKMELYFRSKNHTDNAPKIDSFRMLFRYSDIKDDSHRIFSSWFQMYDVFLPVLHLYFSTRAGSHKYLEGRFLSLAQAVETLHRRTTDETAMESSEFAKLKDLLINASPEAQKEWVEQKLRFANEISLSRRLKSILKPFKSRFGSGPERKRLVLWTVDTRNYLTHYDPGSEEKAADGRNLWILCEKMEALLQLHFLKSLSFAEEQIDAVCNGPQALKGKLDLRFDSAS